MHNVNDVDVWLIDEGAKSKMTEKKKKKKTVKSYIDNLSITNE